MSTVSSTAVDPRMDSSSSLVIEEDRYRAGAYGLLSLLLRTAPTPAVLQDIITMTPVVDTPATALSEAIVNLAIAARAVDPALIENEYHTLFIGVGRGVLVPYGSWYLTGYLMERPLGLLRTDLAKLGFTRSNGVAEPEDHIAALCDVMQMLIQDGANSTTQSRFFGTHLSPWVGRFFSDLVHAEEAQFYRTAGCFGTAFMQLEQEYLEAEF